MVKLGTASEFLKADQVEILRKIRSPDETKDPANEPYQFCSEVEEYFKLDKKTSSDDITLIPPPLGPLGHLNKGGGISVISRF